MLDFYMMSYYMSVGGYLVLMISVLIGVAFLTLYERKFLGYVQLRKGPNKLGFMGLLQPFSDALKLFSKEYLLSYNFNYIIYLVSPVFMLAFSLFIWVLVPFMSNLWELDLGVLFLLSMLSIGVYPIMYSGWASNSVYSLLGSMRAVAQSISYEVSLAMIFVLVVFLVDSFDLYEMMVYQLNLALLIYNFPLFGVFIVSSIAELNRSPFDFVEGESELVSGFNVEYASGLFAFLFLSEYSMIMFFSVLVLTMFVGGTWFNFVSYFVIMVVFSGVILIRGTYPRFRYDKLMGVAWKSLLPFVLCYFVFILGVKFTLMCVMI
uniref:NADH-ubiquinone oxidoreductase chain 1 n=1 Tax=Janus megamaculatus TaxID=2876199 RepID=A0A8K1TP33_9HYME|nr:NADH dehydrogenase subunit 1 [Janus megamaculatus]UGN61614.1 NADH dehydrogenase subunit 1 [Janus megamaculatus]